MTDSIAVTKNNMKTIDSLKKVKNRIKLIKFRFINRDKDSLNLPEKYQFFVYEDRSVWPTKEAPLRTSMDGEKHIDIVPVCYV